MTVKFLDLQAQYREIATQVDSAVLSTIRSAQFIGGSLVRDFEIEFAEYVGASHCVGVGNGTDALEIAMEALALPRGSEVIVPANSFIASSEAVTRSGLRVVFCDVDAETGLLTADHIEAVVSDQTSAVIPVHLYGRPCNMTTIMRLANSRHLRVIEDCAQAHGASHRGRRVGTFGNAATFSFYPGKNLGAYGDGGAILTNDNAVAKRSRMIANHGRVLKYDHEFEGRNSRLDALQAAVLSVKLGYLDGWRERRSNIARIYQTMLSEVDGLHVPPSVDYEDDVHAWHLFTVQSERRDQLRAALTEDGIETAVHYPSSLPNLSAYMSVDAHTPVADGIGARTLSLPMGEHLSVSDAQDVATSVKAFFNAA